MTSLQFTEKMQNTGANMNQEKVSERFGLKKCFK